MDNLESKMCALMDRMKNEIIREIKQEIRSSVAEAIQENIQGLDSRLVKLEEENKQLRADIQIMKDETLSRSEAIKIVRDAKAHAVRNEHYSRKTSIRIFGLKENKDEECINLALDLFQEKLNVPLSMRDINVVHRVGARNADRPRPMLVQFMRKDDFWTVIRARKLLKGSGVTIVEDMPREVYLLLNRVKNDSRITDAWTWDGKVRIKTKDGKVHRIEYGQTLEQVIGKVQSAQV